MIAARRFNSTTEFVNALNGEWITDGRNGTTVFGSTNFRAPNAFLFDVAVGDTIHISGEPQPFTISTIVDGDNVTLDQALVTTVVGTVHWRVTRNPFPFTLVISDPVHLGEDRWVVFYDQPDFVC